jgi:polyphosphate:AMP phosphotransferase
MIAGQQAEYEGEVAMFESAELGNKIDKAAYREEAPRVRAALLEAQRALASSDFAVAVIVAGVEGAGKTETVNLLLEWLDARGVQVHAFRPPSDEERQRPPMWRWWRRLPAHGRIDLFFGAWDGGLVVERALGRLGEAAYDRALDRAVAFDRMLASENLLLVKLWLHLSKKAQKKRLCRIQADPLQSWRVGKSEWKQYRRYDDLRAAAMEMLRRTESAESPWHIIEATDRRYRNLTAARALLDTIQARLEKARATHRPKPKPLALRPAERNVINSLDLTLSTTEEEYARRLPELQQEVARLTRRLHGEGRSLTLVFEGPDAAGKGGTIRRLTQAMDARDYRVISVAAPTDEERARPYLWRFWRHIPALGRVTVYDRSWYGRVLVERVEGFATADEWGRAYSEINDFERQLDEAGTLVLKFWLAISPDEQLRRFKEREGTPYKQYKLTREDWRNREKWGAYEAAACDMVEKTSTGYAPWVLVEANNKEWARLKVLSAVVKRLKTAFREGT